MVGCVEHFCHRAEHLINGEIAHAAVVAEGTGALAAGAAVDRDGELDGVALVVAAGTRINGSEEDDGRRVER